MLLDLYIKAPDTLVCDHPPHETVGCLINNPAKKLDMKQKLCKTKADSLNNVIDIHFLEVCTRILKQTTMWLWCVQVFLYRHPCGLTGMLIYTTPWCVYHLAVHRRYKAVQVSQWEEEADSTHRRYTSGTQAVTQVAHGRYISGKRRPKKGRYKAVLATMPPVGRHLTTLLPPAGRPYVPPVAASWPPDGRFLCVYWADYHR